ncbi:hypothetical protein PN462_15905 [Spirulina sp. CS-785/01]|uniref:hypothetical protein n=1 Tax=Spirulina sp. CS-785/01 TaxID=3021716 RepID=UPI00232AB5CF|nr:hypothetical protein [Spirulina sp. CS-785/01]MDB9314596.1 hypothetical protein [Spirulina sp. CS-785/01]
MATKSLSPQTVYEHLSHLDEADSVHGASYRQEAFEVLSDPKISLKWKTIICDRLLQANQLLALLTVEPDESY